MKQQQFSATSPPGGGEPPEASPPPYYEWRAEGGALKVRLGFEVIDELNFEVMRGFGAIPRRGAEVGGILIGRADQQSRTVTVTGFQPVPCRHARGPSFTLEEGELETLAAALARLESGGDNPDWAVGFYRSSTRDTLELADEDLTLLDRFFPAEPAICLIVRPYATRVSQAAFHYRRDSAWVADGPGSVISFRRKELGGGTRPRRPRAPDPGPAPAEVAQPELARAEPLQAESAQPDLQQPDSVRFPIPEISRDEQEQPPKLRGTWVWVPLSFVFLLLGIVLGFQIALTFSRNSRPAGNSKDPYSLQLSVADSNGSLLLQWNPRSPALRDAPQGVLHIQDGDNSKSVELSGEDIERGGILYRNTTAEVLFRLEIQRGERNTVSESVRFPQPAVSGSPLQ